MSECEKKDKRHCVPKDLRPYISCDEYIAFTGLYDTNYRNVQGNISTLPCEIYINPGGYNIRTAQWYYVNDKTKPNIQFLQESYTISSYDSILVKKKGEITFNGLYANQGTGGITTPSIQTFVVLGGDGIYENIMKVVIDFTDPVRKMYFIKEKH